MMQWILLYEIAKMCEFLHGRRHEIETDNDALTISFKKRQATIVTCRIQFYCDFATEAVTTQFDSGDGVLQSKSIKNIKKFITYYLI